ncbi:MAG: hypothetical protein H8E48_09255 [Chloroflexi bacterium]|nr:hypothetical protein [Chloroflexota bacterium]
MLHTPATPLENLNSGITEHTTPDIKLFIEGSWDHASSVSQMKAIDLVMRWYFKSDDWLNKRRESSGSVP